MSRKTTAKWSLTTLTAIGLLLCSLNTAQADLTDPSNNLYGSGTTTYSVMNTAGASATIVAVYYNPNGTQALSQNLPAVNGLGRTDVTVSSIGLPSNWAGSVVLSADQDIVAAAVNNYTGKNTPTDSTTATPGTEMGAYEALNSGSTKLYAPALFRIPPPSNDNVAARQVTRFTLQNTTASTANYTITYRARDGFLLGTFSASLSGSGSRTFETRKNSDLPASVLTNLAGRGGGFSAEIDSNQPLAGVSESVANISTGTILNNWSGDHALISPSSAALVLYSPAVFRFCQNNPTALANCGDYANINNYYLNFLQYSSFQLQNTTNQEASVSADFINRATGAISYTHNFTIAAYSGYGINMFNGGSLPLTHALFPALGSRFSGSVRFTSNRLLVGTGNVDFPAGAATYGTYNMIGSSDASATLYVPSFNRVCPLAVPGSCNSGTLPNFSKVSVVQIVNVGGSAVTLTGIDLLNPNGTTLLTLTQKGDASALTLQPGQAVGLNLFNGGDFGTSQFDATVGYNFQGSLRVRAPGGSLLKAIVEYRNANLGMDHFNAFNR